MAASCLSLSVIIRAHPYSSPSLLEDFSEKDSGCLGSIPGLVQEDSASGAAGQDPAEGSGNRDAVLSRGV